MPYKNQQTATVSNRERQRRFRERRRQEKELEARTPPVAPPDVLPSDAADLLAEWCASTLVTPAGHPLVLQRRV